MPVFVEANLLLGKGMTWDEDELPNPDLISKIVMNSRHRLVPKWYFDTLMDMAGYEPEEDIFPRLEPFIKGYLDASMGLPNNPDEIRKLPQAVLQNAREKMMALAKALEGLMTSKTRLNNVRVFEDVGFSGNNRIVSIYELEGSVEYGGFRKYSGVKVHYGSPSKEGLSFFNSVVTTGR